MFYTGEANETDHRVQFVGVIGMYILHFQIFRIIDKKLFKSIWDIYKRVYIMIYNKYLNTDM